MHPGHVTAFAQVVSAGAVAARWAHHRTGRPVISSWASGPRFRGSARKTPP